MKTTSYNDAKTKERNYWIDGKIYEMVPYNNQQYLSAR